jgi:hypothetical protein
MSDPFAKVRSGERFRPSALAWNAMLDAGRAVRDGEFDGGAGERTSGRSGAIVPVLNATGGDRARHSVVGLGNPVFTPADGVDAFLQGVTFRGAVPSTASHLGKFAVLLEPAPANQVVRAVVNGVVPVLVELADAGHTCADVTNGSSDTLTSSASGSAQILWIDSVAAPGGGTARWAVVRLGAVCGAAEEGGGGEGPPLEPEDP